MTDELSKKIKKRLHSMIRDMVTDGSQPWAERYEYACQVGLQDFFRIKAYLTALCDTGTITKEKANLLTEAASNLQDSCGWDDDCAHEAERKKHLLQLIREM